MVATSHRDTYITIWRWKPRYATPWSVQRAGVLGAGVSMEARRSDREIREIFKSAHAPTDKRQFDEWGRITLGSRLGDVYEDHQGSPMPSKSSEPHALLPCPRWVSPSQPQLAVPSPTLPVTVASRWVQAMTAPSSHSSSRASSIARHSKNSGGYDSRQRSASPHKCDAQPQSSICGEPTGASESIPVGRQSLGK